MPFQALITKLMPEAAEILHLGKKVSPELAQAYAKELGPMALKRLESAGALDSGGQFLKHMETNLGKDGAQSFLKEQGVKEIKSASAPGQNLMRGVAAAPMAGMAAQQMNPFAAAKEMFGQTVQPAMDVYNQGKEAVASAAAKQMDLSGGKDPGFQQNATKILSNVADPINLVPGAPGLMMQGAQMAAGYSKGGEVMDYKKIHSDANHTIVRHKSGHEIKFSHASLKPDERKELDAVPHYADGGVVDQGPSFWDSTKDLASNMARKVAPAAIGTLGGPLAQSVADDYLNPPAAPDATATNPQVAMPPQQSADPMQMGATGKPTVDAMNQQISGIQNMAKAVGTQGEQELQAAQQQQAQSMDLSQKYTQNLSSLDQERQAIMHDIGAGHIDPDHYVNSMSTGNKVGTAIGLILGGFAPQGTKNPAMEYLQKQIDNDMMAQKADLGRKENLLSANLKQYGNLHDAMSMTKVIQNEIYASKIAQAAASAKSPMAQAAAQQAIGQLKAQTAPLLQEVAQKQTARQGLEAGVLDPSQAVPHLVPKEHQKAVYEEIQKAQDATAIEGNLLKAFDRAAEQNTILRTGAGLLRTPAPILELKAMGMPLVHDAAGRVNEQELNMLAELAPQPGDSEAKIKQKRQGFINFISAKKSAPTAKAYGIDLSRIPSTSRSAGKFKPMK